MLNYKIISSNQNFEIQISSDTVVYYFFFQERAHANASKQEAVRVQSGGMRKIVLRREESEEAHGESSCR